MQAQDQSDINSKIAKGLALFREKKCSQGAVRVWDWSGELDAIAIHSITQELEELLNEEGVSKQCLKRTFTILIEGLQNALLHSSHDKTGPPYGLGVAFIDGQVDLVIFSLADKAHVLKVKELVRDLNGMQEEEIKEHYRMTMNNGKISEKGGAGLGLITMVMRSKDGLHIDSEPLSSGIHVLSCHISVI